VFTPVNDRKQTGSHGNESTSKNRGTAGSGVFCVRAANAATQRRGKHDSTTTEELFSTWFVPKGYQRTSLELSSVVGYVPDGKEGSSGIAIVRNRYQETFSEDTGGWKTACAIVSRKMWKSAIVLQLFVVTTCKRSINPIIQNPDYSHS
jgi:hypothetical protein